MQAAARTKMTAGLGLLSMLLGAVMVVTPTSAAAGDPPGSNGTVKIDGLYAIDGPGHTEKPDDPADDGTDTDPHVACAFELEFFGFDDGQTADVTFTAIAPTGEGGVLSEALGVPISPDPAGGAGQDPDGTRKYPYSVIEDWDLEVFTSLHEVHGRHVKLALTLYDAEGNALPGGQKHKTFWLEECESPPPPPGDTGSISVDKVLTGTAAPAQATTAFPFSVSCALGEVPVVLAAEDAAFALTGVAAPKVISGLPVGATCVVTETGVMGAATTTVRVGEGTPMTDTDVTTPAVTEGGTVAVTFTNDYPGDVPPPPPPPPPPEIDVPEPATLQVVKVVTGGAPTEWTAGFRLVGGGLEEAFDVDEAVASRVFGDLEPGGYAVTETVPVGDPATLVDVECLAGTDPVGVTSIEGTAAVVLGAGDSVVCTFTNDYPVVEPDEVLPEPPTEEPAEVPEVAGDVVTRTLPRTGSQSRDLAALGVFLLVAGAGLLTAGTRRPATVA